MRVVSSLICSERFSGNWLDAGRFKAVPAVSVWFDFDDRHGKNCIFLRSTLSVRLNMIEPNSGQGLSPTQDNLAVPQAKPTSALVEVLESEALKISRDPNATPRDQNKVTQPCDD